MSNALYRQPILIKVAMAGLGRMMIWWRIMLLLIVVWLVVLLMSVAWSPPSAHTDNHLEERVSKALQDLQTLKQSNAEIGSMLSNALGDPNVQKDGLLQKLSQASEDGLGLIGNHDEPSEIYEATRRKLYNDIRELYFFINAEIRQAQKEADGSSTKSARLSKLQESAVEYRWSLLRSLKTLSREDGYEAWREKESNELSDLVQRRIHFLQNPADCENSRKLLCNLNKGCGFGCQLHHLVYCFIMAYGTQRTLIVKSAGWRYNKAGWEQVFRPVSDTCPNIKNPVFSYWPGNANALVVSLPVIDSLVPPRPQFLPPAIPADLAPRLTRLHGHPLVWWLGQFLKYLLRPQPSTAKMLETAKEKLGFRGPIVGVHVRRTDKIGTEAQFHPLAEYMAAVDEWFEEQIATGVVVTKRRVYVASDDPKVITEARKQYSDYEILGDPDIAKTAAIGTRYSDKSLYGIISDIHFLSRCDFLVCTFSSQVCRAAYEIMQSLHVDASAKFRSLDDIYYYGGQNGREWKAVYPHKPRRPEELELELDDVVGVAGNHWDGYSVGKNKRTNIQGLFPSFKVDDKILAVKFPTYPEVPLKVDPASVSIEPAAES